MVSSKGRDLQILTFLNKTKSVIQQILINGPLQTTDNEGLKSTQIAGTKQDTVVTIASRLGNRN